MPAPAGLACVGACLAAMMSPATRDAIAQRVQAEGAARTVAEIAAGGIGPGSRWYAAMTAIESGDTGWIRLAADLRPGTDVAIAETLLSALSTALRRSPAAVLGVMGPHIRPEDICHPRMIEPRPIDVRVFQVHTHDALAAVTDPALRALRDRCLAVLAASEEE